MDTNETNKNILVDVVIVCPHCDSFVNIEQINCAIFRHGSFKSNGLQIPPHSSKADCDAFISKGEIYGCGKPFIVKVDANGTLVAEACDYV